MDFACFLRRIGGLVCACAFAAVFACVAGLARAAPSDPALDEMEHVSWSAKDGAPSYCWTIAQTADGWMWFGNAAGLYRFDGLQFERVDPQPEAPERSPGIAELLALPDGALVIGYRAGGVGVMRDGYVRNYGEKDGLDGTTTYELAVDGDGHLWAGTRNRVFRLDDDRWREIGAAEGITTGRPLSMQLDRHGRFWLASSGGVYVLDPGARRFRFVFDRPHPFALVEDPQGRVWLKDPLGLQPLPEPETSSALLRAPSPRTENGSLFDRDGRIWQLDFPGLERFDSPAAVSGTVVTHQFPASMPARDRLAQESIISLLADREGNIWFSTMEGVHVLRRPRVRHYPIPSPPEAALTSLATTKDGALWVTGTLNPWLPPTRTPSVFRVQPGSSEFSLWELRSAWLDFTGTDGTIRIATDRGLWRLEGQRLVHDLDIPSVSTSNIPGPGLAMPDGHSTWVSTRGGGLYEFRDDRWTRNGGVPELPMHEASALAAGPDGRLWLGYADGRLYVLDSGHAVPIEWTGDLAMGSIRSISLGRYTLIGGDRGITILAGGRLRPLTSDEPGAFDLVTGIAETADGDVWLNSEVGAVRLPAQAIAAAARDGPSSIPTQVLGQADGYPGGSTAMQFTGNTLVSTSEGRLWFLGTRGIGWILPSELRPAEPPHPVLRALIVEGQRRDIRGAVRLPAGTQALQIDYGALNYARPEKQAFRYRLVGLDNAWTDASKRRSAYFTNLGPGRYRFELMSRNEDLVWTSAPLVFEFEITPTFVQTRVFLALCMAASALAIGLLVHWRIRRVMRRERERARLLLGERERIARELHDTLLQGFQSLTLMVRGAAMRLRADEPTRALLEKAASTADGVMSEGRERIHDLRSSGRSSEKLQQDLVEAGRALAAEAPSTRFESGIAGEVRPLDSDVADEAYRIGREALINAFRHSGAACVGLRIDYENECFALHVQDDGRGLDEAATGDSPGVGHWGVSGMRERAARLGATLEIGSRPGAGTRVALWVPAAIAYRRRVH